ncbi:NAD(P)/FAD-dependent oxidoreductase [Piscinibacter sakaiensis]|uniref:Geranylgeranyl reductase n=1 Tax=Piscinibacter sakaiensis TaxID=1547922 RepID=A0A0K8P7K0_PISS1|nr:FAD-dependent monooxygenase [Piscinibacter sakaiensis]GAP38607.1 geranylgeranyl reductase [Piscinibacter sakaiensis]
MPTESSAPVARPPAAAEPGLNRPLAELPAACEVLVVGAGPAGSAAARVLAQAGLDVVLVDQHAFPRDKVCGDGLIPDAHRALERLGLLDEVMAQAHAVDHMTAVAPRGGRVDVPGRLAVLPRRILDLILCRAAVEAGARLHAPLRFVAPLEEAGPHGPVVVGARLSAGGQERSLRARHVVLATGAVPQALRAAGMCLRRAPSGVALRGYLRHRTLAAPPSGLVVVWHRRLPNGYGWIFPCGDGLYNIGVGVEHRHARRDDAAADAPDGMGDVNLRAMLEDFGRIHPLAGTLLRDGAWESPLKGAPLRCSLSGARYARPGLLVAGEALGSTYALTGEGIGKALETGVLAADRLIEARRAGWDEATLVARHAEAIAALQPRHDVYERACIVNRRPWLADLVVWSARRSPRRIRRLSGILDETDLPSELVSWRSWLRLLVRRD